MMGHFVDDEQGIDCALSSVSILLGAAPNGTPYDSGGMKFRLR